MAIADIVKDAQAQVKEMGGGEQFIGKTFDLAATCGAESEDEVFDWLIDLGEALDEKGLQLTTVDSRLYAKPRGS
jgi:hypothetical protein